MKEQNKASEKKDEQIDEKHNFMHLIHDTIARREWNGRRLWLSSGRGADQRKGKPI